MNPGGNRAGAGLSRLKMSTPKFAARFAAVTALDIQADARLRADIDVHAGEVLVLMAKAAGRLGVIRRLRSVGRQTSQAGDGSARVLSGDAAGTPSRPP